MLNSRLTSGAGETGLLKLELPFYANSFNEQLIHTSKSHLIAILMNLSRYSTLSCDDPKGNRSRHQSPGWSNESFMMR
jgi:hypothetical protein